MTEAEWDGCDNPRLLLQAAGGGAGPRKRRLLSAAACRRLWQVFPHDGCRRAVETAELYADRAVKLAALVLAHRWARDAYTAAEAALHYQQAAHPLMAARAAAEAVYWATEPHMRTYAPLAADAAIQAAAYAALGPGPDDNQPWHAAYLAERAAVLLLVRCVFGNPFRPARVDRRPPGAEVVALARAAYEERQLPSGHLDPERLTVLADALEEAGASADVLGHLRSAGPHVRGCFAVDLVLGRG